MSVSHQALFKAIKGSSVLQRVPSGCKWRTVSPVYVAETL